MQGMYELRYLEFDAAPLSEAIGRVSQGIASTEEAGCGT